MNYYVTKHFFLSNYEDRIYSKTIIEEVKMCTVKITIITTYEVVNDGKLAVDYCHQL